MTEAGITIDAKLLQSTNAYFPISVTESGKMIDVRLPHSSNAHEPILVTELGITIANFSH